jgi:type VI secretion system protein ImpJ
VLADEIPQAIQWHEGMLLAPQHFQQNASRQELLVQYGLLLASPYAWGVRRLSIDTRLLSTGTFRVLELEAILPDGSVVSHRPEDGRELMVDLGAFAEQMRLGEVSIYLAAPARSSGEKGSLSRYEQIEGPPTADENTGEGELRVPRLRTRMELLAGETPPPKYASLPLARVRSQDEACTLSDYIPPTMSVPLRSQLGQLCGTVASRLREKAMFVSEQVRAPSAVLDMPLMLENRGRLQGLVAGLPVFEALLATGTAHPLSLYLAMCSLSGNLASLGASSLPPVFSPYRHDDLRGSFQQVIEFALRMINEGIPETYNTYPFELSEGVFSLTFDGSWAGRRLVVGMRLATGISEKELIAWGDECLVGSESIVPSLRERRMRGAPREFLEKDQELVPVRGVLLFGLKADSEFVKAGERLQVLNPTQRGRDASPLEIVLYVKRDR